MTARQQRILRLLKLPAIFLLVGGCVSVTLAWVLAATLSFDQAETESFEGYEDSLRWTLVIQRRRGAMRIESLLQRGENWGPEQATGAPDSPAGDSRTAWCPNSPDGQREWLILEYAQPLLAQRVDVYANMGPGMVDRICALNSRGEEIELWRGTDPVQLTAGVGVSQIPVVFLFKTNRIKIELDSPGVQGWNEIDAVGLVDEQGRTWWATRVTASTTYGQGSAGPGETFEQLSARLPGWWTPHQPSRQLQNGRSNPRSRTAVAYGWPMLAMHGDTTWVLPLRPVWSGLLVDAVCFAVVSGIIWWLLTVPRHFVRELARMRRGACIKCGYDLRYDFPAGCPECGWRRDLPLEQRRLIRQDSGPR